jgi:hypothetical protein
VTPEQFMVVGAFLLNAGVILTGAVWAVSRAQAMTERLEAQFNAEMRGVVARLDLHNGNLIDLRREVQVAVGAILRTLQDHGSRIGTFEGGRDLWLATMAKNGNGREDK